jgi:hypothetical protein
MQEKCGKVPTPSSRSGSVCSFAPLVEPTPGDRELLHLFHLLWEGWPIICRVREGGSGGTTSTRPVVTMVVCKSRSTILEAASLICMRRERRKASHRHHADHLVCPYASCRVPRAQPFVDVWSRREHAHERQCPCLRCPGQASDHGHRNPAHPRAARTFARDGKAHCRRNVLVC